MVEVAWKQHLDGLRLGSLDELFEIDVKCPNQPMFLGDGLTGAIGDLRIYNRALRAAEVAGLAACPSTDRAERGETATGSGSGKIE